LASIPDILDDWLVDMSIELATSAIFAEVSSLELLSKRLKSPSPMVIFVTSSGTRIISIIPLRILAGAVSFPKNHIWLKGLLIVQIIRNRAIPRPKITWPLIAAKINIAVGNNKIIVVIKITAIIIIAKPCRLIQPHAANVQRDKVGEYEPTK
jgi:hypothetical protein